MHLRAENFQSLIHQKPTNLYFLKAEQITCAITNFGARLVALWVPNRHQSPVNVTLGYASLDGYLQQPEDYMGAVIGRCANRIAGAAFDLNGKHYQLIPNEGPNLLHSGPEGLHAQVWEVIRHTETELQLHYLSPYGQGGFPGNLKVTVTYRLEAPATLSIQYEATTDQPTICNLSHHAYWNLSGEGSPTVLDHELTLSADAFTPTDAAQIPTGEIRPVAGTPFDFRTPKLIGRDIDEPDEQLKSGQGYDQNFVLNGGGMREAAMLYSPDTGIRMRLFTDQPGLQFYSGNHLDGSRSGLSGSSYQPRSAVALETQHFPDAVHHPYFPTIRLDTGGHFSSTSRYVFDPAVRY